MNGEAKYRQIADDLRTRIDRGEFAPGATVPGATALARDKGVAYLTARQALSVLEREGRIIGRTVAHHDRIPVAITRRGTGWAGEEPTNGADDWGRAVMAAGKVPSQRIDPPGPVVAGRDLAERFGVPPGTVVIMRHLTRFVGGQPDNLDTFWFLRDVAEGTPIMEPGSIAEGSIAWLEKRLKLEHPPWEELWRPPTPDEAEILRIPPGVSVLELWRTSTANGRVVAVSRAIYVGDRTKLTG